MHLKIKGKPTDKLFSRKLEQFIDYTEHLGMMTGGGWNEKTKTADFYPYAHKASCCDKMPGINRISPAIKAKAVGWLKEHGFSVEVGR